MRKIPTLFLRDPDHRAHVLPVYHPDCLWVRDGEGTATRKHDGTCVMLDQSGNWWARREVKPGKTPPAHYRPLTTDPNTGKTMGWEPMDQSPFAAFHTEAIAVGAVNVGWMRPGTYELVGPKINGNPDGYDAHLLLEHGWAPLSVRVDYLTAPRDHDGLRDWLLARSYEGIVWHHPDGRMAKLKARDFPKAPAHTAEVILFGPAAAARMEAGA